MFEFGKTETVIIATATLLVLWSSRKNPPNPWEELPKFEVHLVGDKRNLSDVKEQSTLFETAEEIREPIKVATTGKLPDWLSGTLLKNGPGLFEFGDEEANHIFDGMTMIRRYEAEGLEHGNGTGSISRKLIESQTLANCRREGRFADLGAFGAPADWTAYDRFMALANDKMADNMVVAVTALFGHYYAVTELSLIIEFDPVTLETLRTIDLKDYIPNLMTMTPHPLHDQDGTLWNMGLMLGAGGMQHVLFKVTPPQTPKEMDNPWLRTEVVAEMPSPRALSVHYFHSFFMTENYVVFPLQPWINADLFKLLTEFVIKGHGFLDTMYWDEQLPMRFRVIEKATGKLLPIDYVADQMGFFHIVNAYEDKGQLVIDAPFSFEETSYNMMSMDKLKAPLDKVREMMVQEDMVWPLLRFALPLNIPDFSGKAEELKNSLGNTRQWVVDDSTVYLHPEELAPPSQYEVQRAYEFPAVNPNYRGKKYRYAYALGFSTSLMAGSIHKLDAEAKNFINGWQDPDCLATEPLFVPRPGSTEEDDGVVVITCLNPDRKSPETSMVVLSSDLEELARFTIPLTSSISFHGAWIDGNSKP